jgi:hypothetical protein
MATGLIQLPAEAAARSMGATVDDCEICARKSVHGKRLLIQASQPALWACEDCQRMLLLRVDDHGTAGD